jgi:DNA-dependent RNA polymerase auxiliary subunit epsilon
MEGKNKPKSLKTRKIFKKTFHNIEFITTQLDYNQKQESTNTPINKTI